MDRQSALHFGVGLGGFSVILMGLATNLLAAVLLAVSILFYVVVYTMWLKPRTPQNIVIGGAAGAFPPLIGWVAATGHLALLPVLLFAIIFLWTPPHFWALSLFVRSDYAAAGIPMLPVVAGVENTRRQIFLYSLPMAAAAIAPWPLGLAGPIYGVRRRPQRRLPRPRGARCSTNRATEPSAMAAGEAAVRFLGPLSVRAVRARWSPTAGWPGEAPTRRSASASATRARIMALAARRVRRAVVLHHDRQDGHQLVSSGDSRERTALH